MSAGLLLHMGLSCPLPFGRGWASAPGRHPCYLARPYEARAALLVPAAALGAGLLLSACGGDSSPEAPDRRAHRDRRPPASTGAQQGRSSSPRPTPICEEANTAIEQFAAVRPGPDRGRPDRRPPQRASSTSINAARPARTRTRPRSTSSSRRRRTRSRPGQKIDARPGARRGHRPVRGRARHRQDRGRRQRPPPTASSSAARRSAPPGTSTSSSSSSRRRPTAAAPRVLRQPAAHRRRLHRRRLPAAPPAAAPAAWPGCDRRQSGGAAPALVASAPARLPASRRPAPPRSRRARA